MSNFLNLLVGTKVRDIASGEVGRITRYEGNNAWIKLYESGVEVQRRSEPQFGQVTEITEWDYDDICEEWDNRQS